jgi:hypothetical protein
VIQIQEGTTQITLVSDAMSTVCKEADVLNIPYTFASRLPLSWNSAIVQDQHDLI